MTTKASPSANQAPKLNKRYANLGDWLRHNRIELVLLMILWGALGWFGWLGYGLIPPSFWDMLKRPAPALAFDGEVALAYAQHQCDLGPRPVGSRAHHKLQTYLVGQLTELGWVVEQQPFTYKGVACANLIARPAQDSNPEAPILLIGAHYDTRRRADRDPDPARRGRPIIGANDGASGVAVLLELARTLNISRIPYRVRLAFFDAEDDGELDGWEFIVGSTYLVGKMLDQDRPSVVIVVDMVGDADQQIYMERNSDPELRKQIWEIAGRLGYGDVFISQEKWAMLDDHTPFLQAGIPAVDIIDFDYPYWHTTEDTCDKLSAESLERVGRVLEAFIEGHR
ncbi:MAG: M28 family peptidase [Anaerolineae bacterium]|nr:M28 family peptidase [Anaerolineae bacterium]